MNTYPVRWDLSTWSEPTETGHIGFGDRAFGGVVTIAAKDIGEAVRIAVEADGLHDADFLCPQENPGSMGHHSAWVGCWVDDRDPEMDRNLAEGRAVFIITQVGDVEIEDPVKILTSMIQTPPQGSPPQGSEDSPRVDPPSYDPDDDSTKADWPEITFDGGFSGGVGTIRERNDAIAKIAATIANGTPQLTDDGSDYIEDIRECGHCGFRWNDAMVTGFTPVPAGRCPVEQYHVEPWDRMTELDAAANDEPSDLGCAACGEGSSPHAVYEALCVECGDELQQLHEDLVTDAPCLHCGRADGWHDLGCELRKGLPIYGGASGEVLSHCLRPSSAGDACGDCVACEIDLLWLSKLTPRTPPLAQTFLKVRFKDDETDDGELAEILRDVSGVTYVEIIGEVPSL